MRKKLAEQLPLSTKLRLRRAAFAPVGWSVRLAARVYNLAERVRLKAAASGVDLRREWDARARPRAPFTQQWGASDFLLLMDAIDGRAERPDPARPVTTSVILLCYNKIDLTFQCIRSLLREVNLSDTEIIVVNNASSDETEEVLSYFDGYVRALNNAENLGFVHGNNRGAELARGKYLLFLNNDTVVMPGWLQRLVETAERDPRVGAVGPMFVYPDSTVQEAGGIIWANGDAYHYGWGRSTEDRRLAFAREVDYITGASLLVRRELFERLGGFDRRYAPIYYEDADLCMGVRSLGYKVVYQPASRIIHFEGATSGTDTGSGLKRHQVINHEKFRDKWRKTLERDHRPYEPARDERAANRRWDTQVVVFDDRIPTPDRDAGSARMLHILRALAEWCHPVFVSTGRQAAPDYERALSHAGVETAGAIDFERLLRERHFSAAILSRPHVAEGLLKAVRGASPRTRVVFDMVDAHSLRLSREHELTGDPALLREAERYRETEARLARSCDLVWCASSADEEFMSRLAPGAFTAVVPTVHAPGARVAPFEGREHLLFVGNFRHRPNADAARFYAREVLPLVRESLPGVELLLVGDGAPPELSAYEPEGVRVLGYVPDIEPLFARARVSVAPVRFGAGINGKIGEALAHGLPVVTTPVGAAGTGARDGEEALIASTPEELAAATVHLYTDAALWRKLSEQGREHVRRNFSPRVVAKVVNDSVRGLLGHFEESLTAPRGGEGEAGER